VATGVPAAAAKTGEHAGERLVRSTLNRYQTAYSQLDAAAATAVYPSIDRQALEDAFNGLASHHVTLGRCEVRVEGAAATADCTGEARWRPKVGGGVQTAPRRWRFELRDAGDEWIITRANVR